MKEENERKYRLIFRVNEKEKSYIETKFKASNVKNLSDYLRYQAALGRIIQIDFTDLDNIKKQIAGACNNINQIARIANLERSVTVEKISEIRELKAIVEETFDKINEIKNILENQLWQ